MRPLIILALLLCLSVPTGCARFKFWRKAESSTTVACGPCVGAPAPELGEIDFEGKPVKLSDYRGKVVVVAFWGSRCMPCLKMIPHEQALVDRYRGKSFEMVGVNTDAAPEAAMKVIQSRKMGWRNCQAGRDEALCERWGVTRLPSIFVIDADGVVRGTHVSGDSLDRVVDNLVAEAERNHFSNPK